MATRLDLLFAQKSDWQPLQHLRRTLDLPHVLRQVLLRLDAEAAIWQGLDDEEETTFQGMVRRIRRLESWYYQQLSNPPPEPTFNPSLYSGHGFPDFLIAGELFNNGSWLPEINYG